MKLKSVLTLSAVAASLMVSGVQNVRAADLTSDTKSSVTRQALGQAPEHAHKIAMNDTKKAAHKVMTKVEKKAAIAKKEAAEAKLKADAKASVTTGQ